MGDTKTDRVSPSLSCQERVAAVPGLLEESSKNFKILVHAYLDFESHLYQLAHLDDLTPEEDTERAEHIEILLKAAEALSHKFVDVTYSPEHVLNAVVSAFNDLAALRDEFDQNLNRLPDEDRFQFSEDFIRELREFELQSDFIYAEILQYETYDLLQTCLNIKRFFGLPCKRNYSRFELELAMEPVVKIVKQIRKRSKAQMKSRHLLEPYYDQLYTLLDVVKRVEEFPQGYNKNLRIKSRKVSSNTRDIIITIQIHKGEGFSEDGIQWDNFAAYVKESVEKAWSGTYVNEEGITHNFSVLIEKRESSESVEVNFKPLDYMAHASMESKRITFDSFRFQGVSEVPPQMIAHEFGHILGLDDRYYTYFDEFDCVFGRSSPSEDLMTTHPSATQASESEFESLYRTYLGRRPETSNAFFAKIGVPQISRRPLHYAKPPGLISP